MRSSPALTERGSFVPAHYSQSNPDAQANARQIEAELERLDARLRESPVRLRDFWNHVKEINTLFKQLKPIRNDDRELLWSRLGALCGKGRDQQDDQRRLMEGRKAVSARKRDLVEGKIKEAHGYAKYGRDVDDLAKAKELLNEALEWMKNGWSGFNIPTQLFAFDDGKMIRTDHDACWGQWQEVNDTLQARRKELGDLNFEHYESEASGAIGLAAYDPKQAKERVKSIQQHLNGKIMTRDQFAEVRRLLDKAWQRATHTQEERHETWREQQLKRISRKQELIESAERAIRDIEDQIDHCRDLEAGARTGEYADRVRGWIEEKYGWIESKREFIRDLEEQIREIESRFKH